MRTRTSSYVCGILLIAIGSRLTLFVQAIPDPLWWQKCYSHPLEQSKKTPSPEPGLECHRYRDLSCCKSNITRDFLETDKFAIFDYSLCSHKSRLSPGCKQFIHDLICYFACSPNHYGAWGLKVPSETGIPVKHVPLCASECNKWWEACKDDYACARNWMTDFDHYPNGTNYCKQNAECKKFSEIYDSADDFCTVVYDDTYRVTPDNEPCTRFSFDASKPNPNIRVAQAAAEKKAWCDCYKNGIGHTGFLYWALYYMGWFRLWC